MAAFFVFLAIMYIAHQSALFAAGHFVYKSKTLSDFIRYLLYWIASLTIVVVGSWFIFESKSSFIVSFGIVHLFTLCFIDFESTFSYNKDL